MSLSESIGKTNAKATEIGEKYLKTSFDYYKLKIFQQLSISISMVFKAIIIGGLLLMGLCFLGIALAFAIGKAMDSYMLGFVIVGAVFIFLSVIALLTRKHINNMTVKALSEKFFD
ncbi:hypothetical protein [Hwangdonia lutea]|uniref:Phage holin family protein n=1 Tax=Hwangdonia lutea TaxID=3075823 RepID=A0AA97HSA7_9FLAO|nr:hypothetical protein [Hwangdonia sp. SCSIO 19198]WOD44910.1 hypothetical protein RNZ46_06480 [Hwangdonia sp. SCSIO 19198]